MSLQNLNLEDLLLDDKGKEEFLTKTDDFHDVLETTLETRSAHVHS